MMSRFFIVIPNFIESGGERHPHMRVEGQPRKSGRNRSHKGTLSP